MRVNSSSPTAMTIGPIVIGRRAPMRCASAPDRGESKNISNVIGTSDAPASSAE